MVYHNLKGTSQEIPLPMLTTETTALIKAIRACKASIIRGDARCS